MPLIWRIEWDDKAVRAFKKLGHPAQQRIYHYLRSRIATDQDPRRFGDALSGDKLGLWRYRVESYRIICRIEDHSITVLVLDVAHRKNAYD